MNSLVSSSATVAPVPIPQLTFTRFIAAMAVIVFHYGQDAFPFAAGFLHEVAGEAGITVSYFFFLSGFILFHVYGGKTFNIRTFFTARVARIVPLYLFAFFISLFCVLVILEQKPWGGCAVLQGLFIHAWFPGNVLTINYPSWSVSVEVFFYVSFPLALLAVQRWGSKRFIFFAAFIWIISIVQNIIVQNTFYDPESQAAGDFIMYFPLWHLNTFLCGIVAGILYRKWSARSINRALPLLSVAVGVTAVVAIITSNSVLHSIMHTGFLSPFYAMITLGLAFDRTWLARSLAARPMVFLGEISYGIYLLQFPVWTLFTYFVGNPDAVKSTRGFYIFVAVLLVSSALSYFGIERPTRKLIRKDRNKTGAEKL